MTALTEIEPVIQDILSTAWAYSGCPTLTGSYWLNNHQFNDPTWVVLLESQGTEASSSPAFTGIDWLKINDLHSPLALFPDTNGYVDSQKLLRCLNIYISTIKSYLHSRVDTPLIQITLAQSTCSLLPAIPVNNKMGKRIYYLIADGNSNWKRLSPDILEV
ncbi:MAG: hypothetical protein F6K11_25605 [Leptolyngbya sp. SIO3F4]|nr:hypothetical protein [Leptolyngbya sp. SIO3F4]